jgi:hypothetical protein
MVSCALLLLCALQALARMLFTATVQMLSSS